MRPLVVGLLGVVLGVGAAQAGECARAYTVQDIGSPGNQAIRRPDLVGKTMSEVRQAGARRWAAVEVATGRERFTVRFDVTPHAAPAVMGFSWSGSKAPGVSWSQHKPFDAEMGATIQTGPLSGLTLALNPCE